MTGYTRIRAVVPQSELHLYASTLQSMTQGRATFLRRFKGYEETPNEVAQKVIAEHAKEKEEELVGA
jgi:elongation factor G